MTTSKQYPFIASRIFGTPLLIHPGKLEIILQALGPRFGINIKSGPKMEEYDNSQRRAAGYRVENGVAIIPIHGTLVGRADFLDAMSGVTGYTTLQKTIAMAESDDKVQHILYDLDTPGGEATLLDGLAEHMYQSRALKPSTALVNEYAASAGYWLASAASEIVMTRAAMVGSIGVVMTHMSVEGAAKKAGIKITHIHAGAHKVDFSPYKDLGQDGLEDAQAVVNELYDLFTATVARNRGIEQAAVKNTEARMFMADAALELGLVDRIDSAEQTLADLQAALRPSNITLKSEVKMSEQTTSSIDLTHPEVVGAIETATAAAVSAERDRVLGILGCEAAEGRLEMAIALAEQPAMSIEAATKVLGKAPKAQATDPNPFASAMNAVGNPPVAPDAEEGSEDDVKAWAKKVAAA